MTLNHKLSQKYNYMTHKLAILEPFHYECVPPESQYPLVVSAYNHVIGQHDFIAP